MGLASELSKLFPVRQRPEIHPRLMTRPLPVPFDNGSRRCRLPTVHSNVDSTENSEEPRFSLLIHVIHVVMPIITGNHPDRAHPSATPHHVKKAVNLAK